MNSIYWNFTLTDPQRIAAAAAEPGRYLGPAEQAEYSRLRMDKRKREFVSSRMAAKDLYVAAYPQLPAFDPVMVEVKKEASGEPYLVNHGQRHAGVFSLSHSGEAVFCALASSATVRFGVDLELIEPRSDEFIQDYLTRSEADIAFQLAGQARWEWVTLAWCSKEALLKGLALGLSVDTRQVELVCVQAGQDRDGWRIATLNVHLPDAGAWQVHCRRESQFLLTLAVPVDQAAQRIRIS